MSFEPSELKVIGKAGLIDKNADKIVTGAWRFAEDVFMGQKLFTGIKQCPYAHAKIKSIDTSAAEKMPGVKAVAIYSECPSPAMPSDGEVWFWGMPVAVVAATDPWLAQQAADQITVQYDVLDFVVDFDKAMESGAPAVIAGKTPNFTTSTTINKGDVDEAMKTADVVFEDTVGWSVGYCHNYPETRSATCWWVGDDVYCWKGTQNLHVERNALATVLKMPQNKVHLHGEGSGGGYGDRKSNNEEAVIAAVLAKKAGMPVNCQWSRAVHAVHAGHSQPTKVKMKVGVKNDGTILAMDLVGYALPANQVRLSYNTDNIRIQNFDINVNQPKFNSFRCTGEHHSAFCCDQIMEEVAEKLNMNPLDFKLKNVCPPDKLDQILNVPMGSNVQKEVLQKVASDFDWSHRWHSPGTKTLADGRLVGVGCSCNISEKGGAMESGRTSIVFVQPDGTAYLNVGIGEASSGTSSAECAIVAERLGLNYEDVSVGLSNNSDGAGYGGFQAGSRATTALATGVYLAATECRNQLLARAATSLKTTVDQLDTGGGKIFLKSDPTKSITIGQATGGNPITGKGVSTLPTLSRDYLKWKEGNSGSTRTMVAEMVEIAVDPETGEIEVLDQVQWFDVGRAILRMGCAHQQYGSMIMEHGCFRFWEQIFDQANGATLNADYLQQRNPTAMEFDWTKLKGNLYESKMQSLATASRA
jgi:xanthine dehydrogenase YagR molybdenum-binding subunit